MKAREGAAPLRQIVEQRTAPPAVVIEAMRALALIGDSGSAATLTKIVTRCEGGPRHCASKR
jgi:hypothetical protein